MPATKKNPAPEAPLDAICAWLDRFVVFPSEAARDVVALWIVHTYCMDAAWATPYLYINSPERESGKTRVLDTVKALVHNPEMSGSMSSSSMFRMIEAMKPTILFDEVDTIFTGAANEDLRGILNSGYNASGTVVRTVPSSPDDPTGGVRKFSTFGPKMMAGINNGAMPDTVASRCIFINLKRKKAGQEVERMVERKVAAQAEPIKEMIVAWVNHNLEAISAAEPKVMEELGDRQWDISEPLVAIAERVKGWGPRARKALAALQVREESKLSAGGQVLQAARELFEETGSHRIFTGMLAERVQMTPKRVGVLLAPYGITPRNLRHQGVQAKGFERVDFEDAWERYL